MAEAKKMDLADALNALNEMTGAAAPFVNFARVLPAVQEAIAVLRSHESAIASLEQREAELHIAVDKLQADADAMEKRLKGLHADFEHRELAFTAVLDKLKADKEAALDFELGAQREKFIAERTRVAGEVAALENQIVTRKDELEKALKEHDAQLAKMATEKREAEGKLAEARKAYEQFMSSLKK